MECTSCGADVPPSGVQCEFCGSTVAPAKEAARADIFARIKRSDAYAQRDSPQRLAELPKLPAFVKNMMYVVPVAFTVLSFIFMVGMWTVAGVFRFKGAALGDGFEGEISLVLLLMSVVPAAFVVFGLLFLRSIGRRFREFQQAPTLARPAVIVGKRTQVSGGSGDSSASTAYFLTAEFEDGSRKEFPVFNPGLYGRLAEDDAGVLFTRGPAALDMDRVGATS